MGMAVDIYTGDVQNWIFSDHGSPGRMIQFGKSVWMDNDLFHDLYHCGANYIWVSVNPSVSKVQEEKWRSERFEYTQISLSRSI